MSFFSLAIAVIVNGGVVEVVIDTEVAAMIDAASVMIVGATVAIGGMMMIVMIVGAVIRVMEGVILPTTAVATAIGVRPTVEGAGHLITTGLLIATATVGASLLIATASVGANLLIIAASVGASLLIAAATVNLLIMIVTTVVGMIATIGANPLINQGRRSSALLLNVEMMSNNILTKVVHVLLLTMVVYLHVNTGSQRKVE